MYQGKQVEKIIEEIHKVLKKKKSFNFYKNVIYYYILFLCDLMKRKKISNEFLEKGHNSIICFVD